MILLAVLSLTVALTATPRAHAQNKAATPKTSDIRPIEFARQLAVQGVPKLAEVSPELYRGAQPTEQGFENLAKMGINIIVDLRGDRDYEREEVNKLGMDYIAIPSNCQSPRDEAFAKFLTIVRENPAKKVFVHCRLGVDRTGMSIAAYRIGVDGWTAPQAMAEMERLGFSRFHRMICPGLSDYEEKFPSAFKADPVFQNLRPKDAN